MLKSLLHRVVFCGVFVVALLGAARGVFAQPVLTNYGTYGFYGVTSNNPGNVIIRNLCHLGRATMTRKI